MDNIKAIIVYHAQCLDGFAAAMAAWLKFGNEALYMPARYNNEDDFKKILAECQPHREVIIVDFSFPLEALKQLEERSHFLTMLDHHKTALEMFGMAEGSYDEEADNHYFLLDSSKAGCILAWDHFIGTTPPLAFKHIDDRDRWQFKIQGTKEFNIALWNHERKFEVWQELFQPTGITQLYQEGEALLKEQANHVEACAKRARPVTLLGQEGLIVNADKDISEIGHELAKRSGTFGLIWYIDSTGNAACSLRSTGDYDVSAMAKQFGGGGHKNAAGFKLAPARVVDLL